jgi:hypothetical protein
VLQLVSVVIAQVMLHKCEIRVINNACVIIQPSAFPPSPPEQKELKAAKINIFRHFVIHRK